MKPKDQIELGQGKMNGLTVNNTEFPGYDISVTAGDVKSTAAAAAGTLYLITLLGCEYTSNYLIWYNHRVTVRRLFV